VIITPHVAGRSTRSTGVTALFKENLRRFANGEPLLNVVDKQKGYRSGRSVLTRGTSP
jgi:phosphoglycerate dehydrogenase-like enzyme